METILITGGAGFIGSSVADRLLKDGYRVVVIDNENIEEHSIIKQRNTRHNLSNSNYKIYKCNIEKKEEVEEVFKNEKIDSVIHLAAKAAVRESLENPSAYFSSNIMGTVNILDTMTKYNVKKMVFASSATVYGGLKEEYFTENMKLPKPSTPYAATKAAGEEICYTYHNIYGLNIVCLRLFTTYGPRQRPDLAISKFTELILNNKQIQMYGEGDTKRDYVYIDDVVEGITAALKYDKTGYEIINIGSGESVSLKDLIKSIENELDKKADIKICPALSCDSESSACNYFKAQKLLEYNPKTSFKDGIKKFISWKKEDIEYMKMYKI